MLPPLLREQLRHLEWADAAVWSAVAALPAARADDRILHLLHHAHLVQHIYLQLWRGEPMAVRDRGSFADPGALQAWARDFCAGARAHLDALSGDDLRRPVRFPWEEQLVERFGAAPPATVEETVVQVVLHTAHHRAQLCTRLRELGGEPPLVDFIAWIWQGKPEPAWPAIPVA